mgnify:CR=1 FL=1
MNDRVVVIGDVLIDELRDDHGGREVVDVLPDLRHGLCDGRVDLLGLRCCGSRLNLRTILLDGPSNTVPEFSDYRRSDTTHGRPECCLLRFRAPEAVSRRVDDRL